MKPIRIIFEKGLELRRTRVGLWFFRLPQRKIVSMAPAEVIQDYEVRPIILLERISPGKERSVLLSPDGKASSTPLYVLTHPPFEEQTPIQLFHSLGYALGAVHYHCGRLAKRYSAVARTFVHQLPEEEPSDRVRWGFHEEPLYEFECLTVAATRAYDRMRYLIWHAFGPQRGLPRAGTEGYFERTIELSNAMPEALASRLKQSWEEFGARLHDYRHFAQHYLPLERQAIQVTMERMHGNAVWAVSIPLPDNPQVRASGRFKYEQRKDMLTYAWYLSSELMDVSFAVVKATLDARGIEMEQG